MADEKKDAPAEDTGAPISEEEKKFWLEQKTQEEMIPQDKASLEELDSLLSALEDRVDAIAEVLKVHGIHVE